MIVHGLIDERKEFPSKYSWPNGQPKPSMWRFTVNNTRYSSGTIKPPAEGTYVEFDAEQKGEYWNATNIRETQAPVAQPASNVVSYAQIMKEGKFPPMPMTNRDSSIHYQSSRKDALVFVDMLLKHELIDFGKAKGAQKIELVEIFVDNYTSRFMDDIANLAPPEHSSPVDAELPAEAIAIVKPARKTKAVLETDEPFNDQLP